MVLIRNLNQSQINGIVDNLKGEVITNSDTNRLMFNRGDGFMYLVQSDLNNSITGLSSITATTLNGTLGTAAQPNVTSLGTLTGLTSTGNVNISSHNGTDAGLQLNGVLVTATAPELNYLADVTPGTAVAGKAIVTDENNSIVGLSNVETDTLTVNGTLVTASAIELNYTDVNTLGVAQPSKALVVDENRDIVNINTLEADFIKVNGTLVTSTAIELNYVDVDTLGTAQPNKAIVLDANKDITGLNVVTATTLNGTLGTAAQPNVTSLGTLTGLTVNGTTNLSTLLVDGVPLNAFNTGGLKLRVYSNENFLGRVVKADVVTSVNFTNYEPAPGITENYSMEIWGYIKPAFTEDYILTVSSNDNFRLWLNNELVQFAWAGGDQDNVQTAAIPLVADKWYPVYIQHTQLTASEKLSLSWSSTSQVSQIIPGSALAYDDKEMTVSSRPQFVQDSVTLYDSANSRLTRLATTAAGDLAITSHTRNVNIVGHNGVDKGLRLDGTLVTSTATELNYVDTTPGAAHASKALVLDSSKDISGVRNVFTEGKIGVNTTSATSQLDVNSATGECLRLLYDNTEDATFNVSSNGLLTLQASGADILIHTSNSFDVVGHNGVDKGLKLAGVLVTATAAEINYVDTTVGTAAASKALILDANKDISGVNVFGADTVNVGTLNADEFAVDSITTTGNVGINTTSLLFGLQVNEADGNCLRLTNNDSSSDTPASKVDFTVDGSNNLTISASGSVNISTHNGSTAGLRLAGTLVTSTAVELNYVDTTPGTVEASKAVVVDSSRNITNLNNVTSTGKLGVNTSAPTAQLEVNSATGECLRLTYDDANGSAENYADLLVSSTGLLTIQASGSDILTHTSNSFDVVGHNGVDKGLKLAGVLVTSTAAELNYVDTTPGTAEASKALILDANRSITNVNSITSTSVSTGTAAVTATTDATSATTGALVVAGGVGIGEDLFIGETLNVTGDATLSANVTVDGPSLRIPVGDTAARPTGTAGQIRYNSETSQFEGFGAGNTWGSLGGVTDVDQDTKILAETSAGADDDNLRFFNAGSETMRLTASGSMGLGTTTPGRKLEINSTTGDCLRLTHNDADGSATNYVDLLVSSTGLLTIQASGTDVLTHTSNSFDVAGHNGVDRGLKLSGTLVTSTAAELNYVDTTPGTVEASKAVVVDANRSITNVNSLTAASVSLTATTDSTSATTGALVVAGGVGIGEDLFIGETLNVAGDATLSANVTVDGPSLRIPVGDTAARPTGTAGQIRYNSETSQFEGFGAGNTWGSLGGVTDVDQDTKILAETSAGADDDNLRFFNAGSETMRLTAGGSMGLGTTTPGRKLEINSTTGDCLRLTHNDADGSAANYADLLVSSAGLLTIQASGTDILTHTSNSFDVVGHNGVDKGLKLAGVLVTATAAELNYVDTTPGTVEASKAVVVDANRSITNVNSLTAASASLTATTDSTSATTGALVVAGGVGIAKDLYVGDELVVLGASTMEGSLEVVDVTDSTSVTTGAVVVAGGVGIAKDIYVGETLNVTGDTTLSANVTVDGPSLRIPVGDTAARPTGTAGQIRYNSETSQFEGFGAGNTWGSLGGVTDVDQDTKILAEASAGADDDNLRFFNAGSETMRLTAGGSMGLGTTTPGRKLEINSTTGDCLRLTHNDADGSATNYADLLVSSAGLLTIQASGTDILTHTSNSFDVVGHNGVDKGLKLAGVLVTATAAEINYLDTTVGTAAANKALILDANKDVSGVNVFGAETVNVGTLNAENFAVDSMTTTGNVGINTTSLLFGLQVNEADGNCFRLTYNDSASDTPVSKADFTMDDSNNLTISASNSVNIATHNGSTTGLRLAGTLITSTAAELNYVDTTPGTVEASKALVVNSSRNLTNLNNLSTTGKLGVNTPVGDKQLEVNSATGECLRLLYNGSSNLADLSVSSDGVLSLQASGTDVLIHASNSFDVAGHNGVDKGLKLAGVLVTATAAEINYLDTTTGTAAASKALVLDANKDVSGVNVFGASTVNVTDVNATTVDAVNVNTTGNVGINTSSLLFGLQVNQSAGNCLRLTNNDSSSNTPASKVDFIVDGSNNLDITAGGSVNISTHDGSTAGLRLAGVLITSTAAELNYVDTTPGTAEASKALVVDASRNISNINNFSANTLNLTFDSATGNTVGSPLAITRTTSSLPANGLGVGMTFNVENSANANVNFGSLEVSALDVTSGSEGGQMVVRLMTGGSLVEAMRLDANNLYTTELFETSDRRVKENFQEVNLEDTHTKIMSLKLTDYNYIGQEKTHRGLIAQEVREVIPAAVEVGPRGDIDDFHTVSNREITNHLVGSVQYLSKKLEEAMAVISDLQKQIADMKK